MLDINHRHALIDQLLRLVAVLGLMILMTSAPPALAIDNTVTGLPPRLTEDNMASIRRVADFAAAITPTKKSVELTYDRLVINHYGLVVQEYFDRVVASGKFVLMLGTVLTGSVLLHDATTMFVAMDSAIIGGTAAAATGLMIYTFEKMALDAGKEAVKSDLTKNMQYAGLETDLMQQIEETINHDKPVQEYYEFIIALGKELEETVKKDYTRKHILLVKFALSFTLVDLAQVIATERGVAEASAELQELLLLAEELQLDILNSQPNSSIASAMMARISALRYVLARNGLAAFEPADEHLFWAIQSLQTALVHEPANHYARVALARLYGEQDEHEEAIHLLEEYEQAGWDYQESRSEVLGYLAEFYINVKRYEEALVTARNAMEGDPSSITLRKVANLFRILRENDDASQKVQVSAADEFEVVLELLDKNEELDDQMCEEDPYYRCGKLISLHDIYYDRALGIAAEIFTATGNRSVMHEAYSYYDVLQEQLAADNSSAIGPGAERYVQAAESFNNSGYWQRLSEHPSALGRLWTPFDPSFWLGLNTERLTHTSNP